MYTVEDRALACSSKTLEWHQPRPSRGPLPHHYPHPPNSWSLAERRHLIHAVLKLSSTYSHSSHFSYTILFPHTVLTLSLILTQCKSTVLTLSSSSSHTVLASSYALGGGAGLVLVVLSSKLLTVMVCLAAVLQAPPSRSFHSVLMFMLYSPAWVEC